jgi:hypothetical protein
VRTRNHWDCSLADRIERFAKPLKLNVSTAREM